MPFDKSYFGSYFIIEHPTRGTLREFVSEEEFRFSTSGHRNDSEKTMQFFTFDSAKRTLNRLPVKIRKQCEIRSAATGFEIVGRVT